MPSAFKPCAGLNQTQKLEEERGEYASSDETGEANKCHKRCGPNGMAKKVDKKPPLLSFHFLSNYSDFDSD